MYLVLATLYNFLKRTKETLVIRKRNELYLRKKKFT